MGMYQLFVGCRGRLAGTEGLASVFLVQEEREPYGIAEGGRWHQKCQNPRCILAVSSKPEMGDYCCKRCHWQTLYWDPSQPLHGTFDSLSISINKFSCSNVTMGPAEQLMLKALSYTSQHA